MSFLLTIPCREATQRPAIPAGFRFFVLRSDSLG